MAGGNQNIPAQLPVQPSGAKRRRTDESSAAGGGSARLREKASACALAKLKAARQVKSVLLCRHVQYATKFEGLVHAGMSQGAQIVPESGNVILVLSSIKCGLMCV